MAMGAGIEQQVVMQARIGADHPSLPGHFPGNPIVPGVVLLDEVVTAIASWRPGFVPAGFPAVKFLSPLRPDEAFTIRLQQSAASVQFECVAGERLLARGSVAGRGQDSPRQ